MIRDLTRPFRRVILLIALYPYFLGALIVTVLSSRSIPKTWKSVERTYKVCWNY